MANRVKDSGSSDYEKLKPFRAEFMADFKADKTWRANAYEDADFYDGNQLSHEEKEALRLRGQPTVTINRIKPKLDAIFGMQTALRVNTKAYPTGDREQEADDLSDYFRGVEEDNDFDEQETLAFEDICIQGRAWYELGKQWDGLKSRHSVRRMFNDDIIPDRCSRLIDLSDGRRLHKTVMMNVEDAIALFPDKEQQLKNAIYNDVPLDAYGQEIHKNIRPDQYRSGGLPMTEEESQIYVDPKQQRIRIITTFYRTQEPMKLYFHPELEEPMDVTKLSTTETDTLELAKPNGQYLTQWKKKLNIITYCWSAELEHKYDVRNYDAEAKFPFVLIPGYIERKSGVHYGLVRQMKDPQKEVNKRRSKLLHLLNVNQIRYVAGAFDNENEARNEFAKPDGWIKQNPGFEVNVDKNLEVSQSHFLLLQTASKEIDDAGVRSEIEGKSNSSSGREFQLRQQQATQGIRRLISNLRSGRRRVALYLLDEYVNENPDVGITKYDIVVEEAPESINLSSETFEQLVSLANNSGFPIPPDMLIKVSPLPKKIKDEFLGRMQQQQQQMQAAQAQQQQGVPGMGQVPPNAPNGTSPGGMPIV